MDHPSGPSSSSSGPPQVSGSASGGQQPSAKPPIIRGAKACTVCRAAKMRCIGAENGEPCNRCKKQNSPCIFEKHRRGRKPGSKLSEASKMLRRLEKGLASTKATAAAAQQQQASHSGTGVAHQQHSPTSQIMNGDPSSSSRAFTGNRERSLSTNTNATFASPTNTWSASPILPTSGSAPGGPGSTPGSQGAQPAGNTPGSGGVQYIQIPEYQQQAGGAIGMVQLQQSPASMIQGSTLGGAIPHSVGSPTNSRKRRSRSPNAMDEDRYNSHHMAHSHSHSASHHHQHSSHPYSSHQLRSGVATSNVRGEGAADDEGDDDSDPNDDDTGSDDSVKREDVSRDDYSMFPANLLAEENKRTSFFKTILNPSDTGPRGSGGKGSSVGGSDKGSSAGGTITGDLSTGGSGADGGVAGTNAAKKGRGRGNSISSPETLSAGAGGGPNQVDGQAGGHRLFGAKKPPPTFDDPITLGLITEEDAKTLFELFFLRLNPFICLFDPVLHSVEYVRSTCPFLFTCLIMAGCKFWKPHLYPACQQLAADTCVKVFQHGVKSVGVVQAFACMVYWKEPDDNNVWMYIGFASRMAVELGLNRFYAKPPENETDDKFRERLNRERTYLVLFVHDRSLAMQTGRHWMLPEDDLVKSSATWHDTKFIRPEDVIVAAFVQLRRIAAETTDVFYLHKGQPGMLYADVNYEILLRGCNAKLTAWSNTWQAELAKADGQSFHSSMLSFFRLHVRLFLNSFGLQSSMQTASRETPSLQALSNCYTSALQSLEIVTGEFAPIGMLRYVQDSITVMTAYSAVFLLRLLRHSSTLSDLHEEATRKIYDLISQTADVYQEAALMATSSGSAGYHARFLRSLVAKDLADKAREAKRRAHKSRDGGESVSGSSANAGSPSLLPSPTNAIPMYHPPAPPQAIQAFNSNEPNGHNGLVASPPPPSDTPNPFVLPPGQPGAGTGSYNPTSLGGPMIHDSSMQGGGHDTIPSFNSALATPMHMQDQSFQFSNYPRPGDPSNPSGPTNALDFQQYAPNSPWDPQNPSLAEAFGQPEYQQLNGVSDADINYWRHMFVNLGFGSG